MSFAGRIARPTLAAASLAAGYTAYASPLRADDTPPRSFGAARPGRYNNGDKLPIYPLGDEEVVTLIEVDNPISPYVAEARIATADALAGVRAALHTGFNKWIAFERKAEHEIKTVLPADENLTPGIIYVLIAGLTGSVLTRTRSFPVRWLTPPLFTLAALPYFLPKTAHNLRSYLSDLEDAYFPEFAERHDRFVSTGSSHWIMTKDRILSAGESASQWGSKTLQEIESSTGLKVGDAIQRGKDKFDAQKTKAQGGVRIGEEPVKVQTVGYVVETKPVAEIVAPVPANTAAPVSSSAVEKPTVVPIPAKAAVPVVDNVFPEPSVDRPVLPSPTPAPYAPAPAAAPTPAAAKPKEENKRLV